MHKKLVFAKNELKICTILSFFLFFDFEIAFVSIFNLLAIDILLLNRRRFMNNQELLSQSISFTQKSLTELHEYSIRNYDKTINKIVNREK